MAVLVGNDKSLPKDEERGVSDECDESERQEGMLGSPGAKAHRCVTGQRRCY